MMQFRLTLHDTDSDNKYDADRRYEYIGDRDDIWHLWYSFTKLLHKKHVSVYSLDGTLQEPEKGLHGMVGYNI